MNAIIYARYSPRRKERDGEELVIESNENQIAECTDYCNEKGYAIKGVYQDEHASGKDLERQGLWDAVDATTKGCVLIVFKMDRLSRSAYGVEHVNRAVLAHKGVIESVKEDIDDSPEGRMMRTILAAFSEYEREQIGIRTKMAMQRYQKQGRKMSSRAPFGWRIDPGNDKMIVEDELQQQQIKDIVRLHDSGLGRHATASRMTAMYPDRKWHPTQIKRILIRAAG